MPRPKWTPPDLDGKVAVVTGASRGVGRGIARVLGECGATVYCVGRTIRGSQGPDEISGTVEDSAEQVTALGGHGIPVACDLADYGQITSLFARVKAEQTRLDILVNNAWGGYEGFTRGLPFGYFWETPFERLWRGMIPNGLGLHMAATHAALPLMLPFPGSLVVSTIAWDRDQYLGGLYDVSKHAIVRFIYGVSRELRPYSIAAVAVAPGFTRTERVLSAFKTDDQRWRDIPALQNTESPEYTGRAIARLAVDLKRMRKSGCAFRTGDLAREYEFTDVDGRRVRPFHVSQPYERLVAKMRKKSRASESA